MNQNHFAGLLEMALPFVVMYGALLLRRNFRDGEWPLASTAKAFAVLSLGLTILLGIIYSFSRMGLTSTLASLLLMLFLTNRETWSFGKKAVAAVVLLAGLPLSIVLLSPAYMADRFAQTANELRPQLWADTVNMVWEYPLVGCGFGGFANTFLKYQTVSPGWAYPHAHNDYLQFVAELGVAGAIFPAALMLTIYVLAWRATSRRFGSRVRYLAIASTGALTAIALHSLTDFNMYIPANAMALAWISGIASILGHAPVTVSRDGSGAKLPSVG